jgi:uncharacterized membrane protein
MMRILYEDTNAAVQIHSASFIAMHWDRLNSKLLLLLKWATVLLILKVCVVIVSNYSDYFPPNFNSEFLAGRRESFYGIYRPAFYAHILASPAVLVIGLLLLNGRLRQRFRKLHRMLGRVQVALILLIVVPSALVMSQYAFADAVSGFVASSILTGICAAMGWRCAMQRKFDRHRIWMLRCYVLLCSAVTLRLLGGLSIIFETDSIASYRFASWASWLGPLLCLEVIGWVGRSLRSHKLDRV